MSDANFSLPAVDAEEHAGVYAGYRRKLPDKSGAGCFADIPDYSLFLELEAGWMTKDARPAPARYIARIYTTQIYTERGRRQEAPYEKLMELDGGPQAKTPADVAYDSRFLA